MKKSFLSLLILLSPTLAFAETGATANTGTLVPLPPVSCESVYRIA